MAFGLAALYSCTVPFQTVDGVVPATVARSVFLSQLSWVGIGVIVAALCMALPIRLFESFAYLIYAIAVVALALVLVIGDERSGSRRWLEIGPLAIQPSEAAKLAAICVLARFLAMRRERGTAFLLLGCIALIGPLFVLVLREPDLGTSLVFLAFPVAMLFWAGARATLLIAIASPLLSAFVMFYGQQVLDSTLPWALYIIALMTMLFLARTYLLKSGALIAANVFLGLSTSIVWDHLRDYQRARILSFLSPGETDLLGHGYQAMQSKVAIGSGGLLGKGYLHGSQKGLAFLPERHTDFIFSVVGEEFGLWGASLVVLLFALLVHRAIRIATTARRPFASLLAIGVGTYFFFQAVVNIGITVGLLPVTGLPLPFISKGGTSMLTSCAMMGLLLNVSRRWSEV
jgi:rod shape determining protein RodA